MNLAHLSPLIPLEDLPIIEKAYAQADAAVKRAVADRDWVYRKHVERTTVDRWTEIFHAYGDLRVPIDADQDRAIGALPGSYGKAWRVKSITKVYTVTLTQVRAVAATGDNHGVVIVAQAAADALMAGVDWGMICSYRTSNTLPSIATLIGDYGATIEVVLQALERHKTNGTMPAGWDRARAVVAVELEHLPPQWVRDGITGEPVLESILMSRIAGVVPNAVRVR